MSDNRVWLSAEEAISVLPEGDNIHTFRSAGTALLGADWMRKELINTISESLCEVGGEACRAMRHGLVVWTQKANPLFVECDDEKLGQIENAKAIIPTQF